MPIFKYTVVNRESKKLLGSIETPDEKTARDELNNLGFSILELEEISKEEMETEKPETKELDVTKLRHKKFSFEAMNAQGQTIVGTISADDDFSAFKRLTKEYELTVTAIWEDEASEEQIRNAKVRGTFHLQQILNSETEDKKIKEVAVSQEQRKKELFVKTKIEYILRQVNDTLAEYGKDISVEQRKEIDKRIDKLLRIKNSTNFDYIIQTAEDLLKFIQKQEVELKNRGYLEKRAKLIMKVKDLINRLHDTGKPKSLSEDIIQNIQDWQQKNISRASKIPWHVRVTNKLFIKIKHLFEVPAEIQLLKNQIKTYNSQIFEYIKLYLKEPTKEYKQKTAQAIKTIWNRRKQAVEELKQTKERIKKEKSLKNHTEELKKIKEESTAKIFGELTEFTGWLLAFYLIYYFFSLYITSKDFGLGDPGNFPKSLDFYHTQIFKYVLIVVFLIHVALTVKTNFFKRTKGAGLILFPLTTFLIIFVIVNF
ncbi:MAG: hypothetical protein WC604_03200 [Candidatus Gracilibacteria bacterium]